MKILANLSRILVGAYLMFSGFLKIVDPYGTSLKLKEYFEVFAGDLPSFATFFGVLAANSTVLSVGFCCLELIVGVGLFFGFKLRLTSWVTLLLMTFFTFLTFYSAYYNKVTDCGCFGEFMKLKPWTSFYKNVVAMVFILIIFAYRKHFKNSSLGTPAVLISSIISLGIGIYSLTYLPVIDMLPYAVGKSIPEQMKKPDVPTLFEYQFLDKNTQQVITSTEFLEDTLRYEYQDSKILNEDEIKPVITDFSFSDTSSNDVTTTLFEGNHLLLIIKTTEGIEDLDYKKYRELSSKLSKHSVSREVLTSAVDIEPYLKANKITQPYYTGDEKVLKTIARNNPILVLLKEGTVVGKWSLNQLPSDKKIIKLIQ